MRCKVISAINETMLEMKVRDFLLNKNHLEIIEMSTCYDNYEKLIIVTIIYR